MTDLQTRFRSYDTVRAPEYWPDVLARAAARPDTSAAPPRRWLLPVVLALLLLGLVGGVLLFGSDLLPIPGPSETPNPTTSASPAPSVEASPVVEDLAFDCDAAQARARSRTDRWEAGPAPSGPLRSGWIAAWRTTPTAELVLVNPLNGETCSLTTFEGLGSPSSRNFGGGPLVWSPDGSALAIMVFDGDIGQQLFIWSRLGLAGPFLPVDGQTSFHGLSWSPDGTRLAVVEDNWRVDGPPADPASAWIVASDGSAHDVQADCEACYAGTVFWSPSGDGVAMHVRSDQDASVAGITAGSADGAILRYVPGTEPRGLLGWADEDSLRILQGTHLLDISLDGRERVDQGVVTVPNLRGPVSPDGRRDAQIVEGLPGEGLPVGDLTICEVFTTQCDLVASDVPASVPLWWSPDGQTLGYLMNVTCGPCPPTPLPAQGIWLVNADGTGHRQLTDALSIDYPFAEGTAPAFWQPVP